MAGHFPFFYNESVNERPVSYTHLDVYKRQESDCVNKGGKHNEREIKPLRRKDEKDNGES